MLSPRRVVQPDVVFISNAIAAIIQDHIRGVSDLVVEVISPGSWRRDRVDKKALYEQHGVQEYWLIDPEAEMIEAWALVSGSYSLVGRFTGRDRARPQLLEGFEVAVSTVISQAREIYHELLTKPKIGIILGISLAYIQTNASFV